MPDHVTNRVNVLARRNPKGLEFKDRNGNLMQDDYIDEEDDDSSYVPDDVDDDTASNSTDDSIEDGDSDDDDPNYNNPGEPVNTSAELEQPQWITGVDNEEEHNDADVAPNETEVHEPRRTTGVGAETTGLGAEPPTTGVSTEPTAA